MLNAPTMNGATGVSDMAGKAARVAVERATGNSRDTTDRHACGWSPCFRTTGLVPATSARHAQATRQLAAHRPRYWHSLERCGRRYFGSLSSRVMRTRYELITCLAVASHEGGFTGARTTTVSLSKFPNSPAAWPTVKLMPTQSQTQKSS